MSPRRSKGSAEPASELGPLPAGHHGLTREQVVESQRERLLAGIADAVARDGYRSTTVTAIVKAASVSSRAFYENFDSKEDCFLAAFDAVVAHVRNLIAVAIEPIPDWPDQTVAALRAAVEFFAAEPRLARLCLVEPVTATPASAARYREVVLSCVPYLKLGRRQRSDGASLPDSTEDSLLGGAASLVSRSIGPAGITTDSLLPDLVEFVLSPYLGPAAAKRYTQALDRLQPPLL